MVSMDSSAGWYCSGRAEGNGRDTLWVDLLCLLPYPIIILTFQ